MDVDIEDPFFNNLTGGKVYASDLLCFLAFVLEGWVFLSLKSFMSDTFDTFSLIFVADFETVFSFSSSVT